MRAFACLFFLFAALMGFAQIPQPQWSVVESGEYGQLTEARTATFQTEGQLNAFYKELTGEAKRLQGIDWTKEFAIAVCLGTRKSGGYKVQVDTIERAANGQIRVTYAEMVPTGMTSQALTSPWEIVRVQRGGGAVVFDKITRNNSINVIGGGRGGSYRWRTYMADVVGGGGKSVERIINESQTWGTHWLTFLRQQPPQDIPDFGTESVVAIHLGRYDTSGYDVLIDCLESNGPVLTVRYVVKSPSRGQVTRRVATEPFVLIRIPKHTGVVRFERRTWNSDGF